MSLLQIKSLSIGYKEKNNQTVLQKDIHGSIEKGEIISLMGQNGVGKTTFIKTIAGLLPEISGEVLYDNTSISDLTKTELSKKLSLVLTEKPYAANLTVIELIAIGRHPYSNWLGVLSKKDKEAIEQVINAANINYIANKKLYQLSDGQLQKVMIARALAQDTNLIILDEPTAHLDLSNKIEIMLLLRQIANEGKGIIIATHDMQISTQLSDNLWLFNFNQPLKTGVPEDLILNGQLEKSLFLESYNYNMIYGIIEWDAGNNGNVSISGQEMVVYWTSQALKRNGFNIVPQSERVIQCKAVDSWSVELDNKSFDCSTIQDVLKYLLN